MTAFERYFRDHEARWNTGPASQRARRRWLSPLRRWWASMGSAFMRQHDGDMVEALGEIVARVEDLEAVLRPRHDEWDGE